MRKILTITLFVLFLLGLILGSFPNILFGDLLSTHYGTTMKIVQDAMYSKSGTWILQCPGKDCYLFVKAFDQTIGFVGANLDDMENMVGLSNGAAKGNMTSIQTAQAFIKSLNERGWKEVPPSTLPIAFRTLVNSGLAMHLMSKSISDLVIVPVAPFLNYPFDTGTTQ